MPPITLIEAPPPHVSPNAEAFVWSGEAMIYVITSAPAFREASCRSRESLLKLASVLVHEEWHVRHGGDERAAYDAQLMTLLALGARVDSRVYRSVFRSREAVVQRRLRPFTFASAPASDMDASR